MLDASTSISDVQQLEHVVQDEPRSDRPLEALHARFLRRKREQSAWDAEEARDLRVAESRQIWLRYGCVTLVEYLEHYCGIEPRTALERIRVSFALADLPLLEAELEAGTFQFSHVKELSRILVADTEREWVDHVRGMNYREVQRAVAGHVRGDRPADPTQPDERRRFVGFHLKPSTAARLFALLGEIASERGDRFVDDDDRVHGLCDRAAAAMHDDASVAFDDPSSSTADSSATDTASAATTAANARRAHHRCCAPARVWITTDGHAFSHGVELDDAERDALLCDATIMGHVDDPSARPHQTIPAKTRNRILARDLYQCGVPGCRSRHHLDVHHIVPRQDGGDHSSANLITLCSGHHRLHHAGYLAITGRAPNVICKRANDDEREGTSRPRGRMRLTSALPRR